MVRETDKEKLARYGAELKAMKRALRKREKRDAEWSLMLRKIVARTLMYLILMGGGGLILGWKIPLETRLQWIQAITDWALK